jgi:hypothetical protein
MSENVGASTSHNPKGLHGLYRDNYLLLIGLSIFDVTERCGLGELEIK